MFYTERLMLRSLDLEADKNTVLQWQNDLDFSRATRHDAPRETPREQAKKFIETLQANNDDLPCFAVCEKPSQGGPETLTHSDDLFLQIGMPMYPMVGILTRHARPRCSFVNSTVRFGVAFAKEYRGECELDVAAANSRDESDVQNAGRRVRRRCVDHDVGRVLRGSAHTESRISSHKPKSGAPRDAPRRCDTQNWTMVERTQVAW